MSKGGHVYKVRNITPARLRQKFLREYIFAGVKAGLPQAEIARQIEAIGRGNPDALRRVPPKALEGVVFPPNFTYSREAVRKRVHEILAGVDKRDLENWRKVTNERCEDAWMGLYKDILSGDAQAVNAGMRVIVTQARALGFLVDKAEVMHSELAGEGILTREMLDRLTDDELATLDYLLAKMHGKEPIDVTPTDVRRE